MQRFSVFLRYALMSLGAIAVLLCTLLAYGASYFSAYISCQNMRWHEQFVREQMLKGEEIDGSDLMMEDFWEDECQEDVLLAVVLTTIPIGSGAYAFYRK